MKVKVKSYEEIKETFNAHDMADNPTTSFNQKMTKYCSKVITVSRNNEWYVLEDQTSTWYFHPLWVTVVKDESTKDRSELPDKFSFIVKDKDEGRKYVKALEEYGITVHGKSLDKHMEEFERRFVNAHTVYNITSSKIEGSAYSKNDHKLIDISHLIEDKSEIQLPNKRGSTLTDFLRGKDQVKVLANDDIIVLYSEDEHFVLGGKE